MNLLFWLAVAVIVTAMTPLALPLLGLAKGAAGLRSDESDGSAAAALGAGSELEAESWVRDRLYGRREEPAVTKVALRSAPWTANRG